MNCRALIFGMAVVIAAGAACAPVDSAPAANLPTLTAPAPNITVAGVMMSRDDGSGQPGETVDAFKPGDHTMHFEVRTHGLEPGQKVRLVFVAVDTANGSYIPVATAETEQGLIANQITGQVSLDTDWPLGKYELDIYVEGYLIHSWKYEVKN